MIVDFLKTIQEAYMTSREKLEQELRSVRTEIAETNKFLALLESESEGSFTQFTPRNVTNRNTKKIDELTQNLADLNNRQAAIQKELDDVLAWLWDIEACLEEVNVSTTKVPTKDVQIDKVSSVSLNKKGKKQKNASSSQTNGEYRTFSKDDILRIANYLPADPMRARVELLEIVKGM